MIRFSHLILTGLGMASLVGCQRSAAPPAAPAAEVTAPGELLNRLVDRYWDDSAALDPWYPWGDAESRYGEPSADTLSEQALADSLALERRYLADLSAISRTALDADSMLTYDLFRRERELAVEGFTYPSELLPVNPFDSMPQRFALMAPAAERYALSSAKDFESWRIRAENFTLWTEQAIAAMRDGMRRGYTLPRVLVEKTLPQLAALGDDTPANAFYEPLRSSGGTTADAERTRLRAALAEELKNRILPSYRSLHDFMQREYLPRTRDSIALSAFPLGADWYAYLVKRAIGNTVNLAELHALGLAEVERAHARFQALLAETAFAGNSQGFFEYIRHDPRFSYGSAEDLLSAYQTLKSQVAEAMPNLFSAMPHGDFEIRAVEAFREPVAPALSYLRSMAYGKRPAVLYIDTAGIQAQPDIAPAAGYLREAVPGHHYQLALQQERVDLPRFRRFGGAPAFIEGWGLYAATLGEELGIYRDPEAKSAALLAQLDCAARLVIDTAVQTKGWSRRQAIDFLHAQMPIDDAAAVNEVDRVLAFPGESLACTAGYLKIQGLRLHAQQVLGPRFDLRAFHAELLKDGAVPLDLLDAKMRRWLEATLAAPPPSAAAATAAVPAATATPAIATAPANPAAAAAEANAPPVSKPTPLANPSSGDRR